MGLFDNLFKAKPESADEAVVEPQQPSAEPAKERVANQFEGKAPNARLSPGSPTQTHTLIVPRANLGRSLGQIVSPVRPGAGSPRPPGTKPPIMRRFRSDGSEASGETGEVVLSLSDILPRIAPDLLAAGPHDETCELRFQVEDLSADISKGRASVPLVRIAAQVPGLLKETIGPDDVRVVSLPLQKLVEQIAFLPTKPIPAPELRAPEAAPMLPPLPPSPPPAFAPPVEIPPEPAPMQLPPTAKSLPPNTRISLNLAAVVAGCPRELIVGELPPIAPEERISFPWSPIEQQIAANGVADVSSVRFVFALPAWLQASFEAREGVRVSLPLDEIQRNFPAPPGTLEAPDGSLAMLAAAREAVVQKIGPPASEPAIESELVKSPVESNETIPTAEVADEIPLVAEDASANPLIPEPSLESPASGSEAPVDFQASALAESLPTPPNVWMQPPADMALRAAQSPSLGVEPPASPILPVRIVIPPPVRPPIVPPPLFGGETESLSKIGDVLTPVEPSAEPALPPEPSAPADPPRPLELTPIRQALALGESADLSAVAQSLAHLPGMMACVLKVRHEHTTAGELPEGFVVDSATLLSTQLSAAIDAWSQSLGGSIQHLTVFAEQHCVSVFARGQALALAVHRTRSFMPGVREKLAQAVEALAQA